MIHVNTKIKGTKIDLFIGMCDHVDAYIFLRESYINYSFCYPILLLEFQDFKIKTEIIK